MLFSRLLSLSSALTLTLALAPTKVQRDFASINPSPSDISDARRRELLPREPVTNARRLAAGLPPLPPVRRGLTNGKGRGGPVANTGRGKSQPEHNTGGPAHNIGGPKPSAKPDDKDVYVPIRLSSIRTNVPHSKKGYLKAYDADNNFQGYVSNIYNSFGEYSLDTDSTKALEVKINAAAQLSHMKALVRTFIAYRFSRLMEIVASESAQLYLSIRRWNPRSL